MWGHRGMISMSSAMNTLTMMVSGEKNPQHEQHVYQIYNLVSQMIAEAVPPLVKQCVEEIMVDVRTTLNGKPDDLSGLKDDITRKVLDGIKKGF